MINLNQAGALIQLEAENAVLKFEEARTILTWGLLFAIGVTIAGSVANVQGVMWLNWIPFWGYTLGILIFGTTIKRLAVGTVIGALFQANNITGPVQGAVTGLRFYIERILAGTILTLISLHFVLATWSFAKSPGSIMVVLGAIVIMFAATVFWSKWSGGSVYTIVMTYAAAAIVVTLWFTVFPQKGEVIDENTGAELTMWNPRTETHFPNLSPNDCTARPNGVCWDTVHGGTLVPYNPLPRQPTTPVTRHAPQPVVIPAPIVFPIVDSAGCTGNYASQVNCKRVTLHETAGSRIDWVVDRSIDTRSRCIQFNPSNRLQTSLLRNEDDNPVGTTFTFIGHGQMTYTIFEVPVGQTGPGGARCGS